jgi:hypothetical protein
MIRAIANGKTVLLRCQGRDGKNGKEISTKAKNSLTQMLLVYDRLTEQTKIKP